MCAADRDALAPAVRKAYSRIEKWAYLNMLYNPCVMNGGTSKRRRTEAIHTSSTVGLKSSQADAVIWNHLGVSHGGIHHVCVAYDYLPLLTEGDGRRLGDGDGIAHHVRDGGGSGLRWGIQDSTGVW